MPTRGSEIAYELRCLIIGFRLLLPPPTNQFHRIALQLQLETRVVQRIYQRAREKVDSNNLREVLACIESLAHLECLLAITNDTQPSIDLYTLILQLDNR